MKKQWWLRSLGLAVVVGLAFTFRFYDITHHPPGLFPDQAANGEDALLILQGDRQPFFPRGNGREALFFYLQAGFIKLFGIGVWPMFAASAVVGTFAVLFTYLSLLVWFGPLAAWFGGLFMATNHWAVTISRTGFRAGMIPLFVAAFTAFVGLTMRAVTRKQYRSSYIYAALAGAAFMGGFYTYIAYRVMVVVVMAIFILFLIPALHSQVGFPQFRRYWRQCLAALIAGLLTIAPLGWYFVGHPEAFVGRAGQVSVFNPNLQLPGGLIPTVIDVARKTILSFFVGQGDLNWRHNVAGFPLLNPLVAIVFLWGLVLMIDGCVRVVWRIVRGQELGDVMVYPYLALLLIGMLAPVIATAEGIPHALRSVGVMVPIFVVAGIGMASIWRWVAQANMSDILRKSICGVFVGLCFVFILYDFSLYFLIARNDSKAYYEYRGDLTTVAAFINEYHATHSTSPRPYLVLDAFSLQTVHFLSSVAAHQDGSHPDANQHKYVDLNPADSHLTALLPGEIIIFTQSTIPDADRYSKVHPNVELITSRRNRWGQEIMRIYGVKEVPPDGSDLDA